ncbi:hypothetical protein DSO57_1036192 [Entomophthora muscae]|uniref:Uncharacterized protein n=1 Tax=Entomophthora muscae TaxID=34485 RepID=A0ACC2SNQ2_9FUNG|nr:hypothetical protein DSO57_1036192 [Entomophthora muscae]
MTIPSSQSLAMIQDTLWGLVDRNPTRPSLTRATSGRTLTHSPAHTWSLDSEHSVHLLASCRDHFNGVQPLYSPTFPRVFSLNSCLSSHPSVALDGILVDLSPGMGAKLVSLKLLSYMRPNPMATTLEQDNQVANLRYLTNERTPGSGAILLPLKPSTQISQAHISQCPDEPPMENVNFRVQDHPALLPLCLQIPVLQVFPLVLSTSQSNL